MERTATQLCAHEMNGGRLRMDTDSGVIFTVSAANKCPRTKQTIRWLMLYFTNDTDANIYALLMNPKSRAMERNDLLKKITQQLTAGYFGQTVPPFSVETVPLWKMLQ